MTPLELYQTYRRLTVPLYTLNGTQSAIVDIHSYHNASPRLQFYVRQHRPIGTNANLIRDNHRSGALKTYLASQIRDLANHPGGLTSQQANFITSMASNIVALQRAFSGKGSPAQIRDALTATALVYEVKTSLTWQRDVSFPAAMGDRTITDAVRDEEAHMTDATRVHYDPGVQHSENIDITYRNITQHTTFIRQGLTPAQVVLEVANQYIGLDCNGFAGNFLMLAGLTARRDIDDFYIPSIHQHGYPRRRRSYNEVQPNDLIVWNNDAHIAVVHEKVGQLKLNVCESCESNGHIGPTRSDFGILNCVNGLFTIRCIHGANLHAIIVPPSW